VPVETSSRRAGQETLAAGHQLAPVADDFCQNCSSGRNLWRLHAERDALSDTTLDMGEPSWIERRCNGLLLLLLLLLLLRLRLRLL